MYTHTHRTESYEGAKSNFYLFIIIIIIIIFFMNEKCGILGARHFSSQASWSYETWY